MSKKSVITAALIAIAETIANLNAKLATAIEKQATLQNQLDNFDRIAALDVGSEVVVTIGRGETKATVVGVIEAVKPGEVIPATEDSEESVGPRTFKIKATRTGDEFDAEFVVLTEDKVSLPEVAADTSEEAAE